MKYSWGDPLDFKHGLAGLEVKDMTALGMGDPPAIEPSIARHLNPSQGGLLAPPKPVLPSKMDRFSASIHQASYKASALAVRALNVSSLLSAYQAELLEDMGQQLEKGSAPPSLWKEIVTVNDLVLRNARQAVQASGRSMALSVVGERALWLNLSGLPDSEKRRVAGAPVEAGQALFGPAVALMQQRCDDKKKEDEAFKLCLPRKSAPRQVPPPRPPNPSTAGRNFQGPVRGKPRGKPPVQHGNPPPAKPWGKTSLPRPRLRNLTAPLPLITNASGRPDVRPRGASSPCSRADSPLNACSAFHIPPLKKRRVFVGEVSPPLLMGALPVFKGVSQFPVLPSVCPPVQHTSGIFPVPKRKTLRKCAQAVSSHSPLHLHLTSSIKASAPVFPNTQKIKTSKCLTNHMNSLIRENLSLQIFLNPRMSPLVRPLDGAIASQMSQPGTHEAISASQALVGTLASYESAWQTVSAPEWVTRTITQGYRLQFVMKPPHFNGVLSSHTEESAAHILNEEISSLLDKGAIQVVPHNLIELGFYSRYFLVPKKDGSLRPILDLRVLNKHLRKYNFRMLTHGTLARAIKQNDWFTSVDLKDAFFHISIYPPHRKFLRFAYQGTCYEFTVLPFGLALSPRTFCLCAEAGLAPLRLSGLRILTYIDDWLIIAESKEKVQRDTRRVLTHITSLGFRVNVNKSNFTPSQSVIFLGLELNSVSMRARLSQERVLSLMNCVSQFREERKYNIALVSDCRV
ncbi:uncharacterized protein LOC125244496 [Megalobrama amblycephala]|uniref:uncharacterized protein LOC125244496 n=1 Tax=Megalobrama amblycephala TaxID=75352 RepID=UPI002014362D|nr:uncharacterized protein LOC125244496 [Megalobrama amblycephala]